METNATFPMKSQGQMIDTMIAKERKIQGDILVKGSMIREINMTEEMRRDRDMKRGRMKGGGVLEAEAAENEVVLEVAGAVAVLKEMRTHTQATSFMMMEGN
jgi:hypothetical protein